MDENVTPVVEEPVVEPEVQEAGAPVTEEPEVVIEEPTIEPESPIEEPAIEEEVPVVIEEPIVEEPEATPATVSEEQFTALQTEFEILQSTHSALATAHTDLQNQYAALQTAHAELLSFKEEILNERKDKMIESFYMLSDDEKKDIVDRKAQYTVEEIEEKLSVLCFRKGNFDLSNTSKNDNNTEAPPITFNIPKDRGASKPAWLHAVEQTKNKQY